MLIGIYGGVSGKSDIGFAGFDEIPIHSVLLLRCCDALSACFVQVDQPKVVLEWTGSGFKKCDELLDYKEDVQYVHANLLPACATCFNAEHLREWGIPLNKLLQRDAVIPTCFSPRMRKSLWRSALQVGFAYFHCLASVSGFDSWSSVIRALDCSSVYVAGLAQELAYELQVLAEEGLVEEMPRLQSAVSRVLQMAIEEEEEVDWEALHAAARACWPGFALGKEEDSPPPTVVVVEQHTSANSSHHHHHPAVPLPPPIAQTARMDWML